MLLAFMKKNLFLCQKIDHCLNTRCIFLLLKTQGHQYYQCLEHSSQMISMNPTQHTIQNNELFRIIHFCSHNFAIYRMKKIHYLYNEHMALSLHNLLPYLGMLAVLLHLIWQITNSLKFKDRKSHFSPCKTTGNIS